MLIPFPDSLSRIEYLELSSLEENKSKSRDEQNGWPSTPSISDSLESDMSLNVSIFSSPLSLSLWPSRGYQEDIKKTREFFAFLIRGVADSDSWITMKGRKSNKKKKNKRIDDRKTFFI